MSDATYWDAYDKAKSEILKNVAYVMADKKAMKFWAEYDAAKRDSLKMAAQLSSHEKGLMVQDLRWTMSKGVRHNAESLQGKFEDGFHSLDFPYENGVRYDYNEGCISANRLYYNLDEPYRERRRWLKIRRALYKLRQYPELQATLKAIFKYRFQPRQKIFSALKIRGETYEKRVFRVREILKIGI